MKSDEKLFEICLSIYREAYRKASPSADFDKLRKSGVTAKREWYMKYFLPNEEYKKIVEKHCKRNKLTKYERGKVNMEAYLGCGPAGWKDEGKKVKKR